MASYKEKGQFLKVPLLLSCCLLWNVYLNEGREISFRVQSDDVIFEGDTFQMVCEYSFEDELSVNISISSQESSVYIDYPVPGNDTYTSVLIFVFSFSRNDTFSCTVQSNKHMEVKTLSIVAEDRKFPYCSSNSSNEIIEGDGILLSCYDDATEGVDWVTNKSKLITQDTSLLNKMKWEAEIRPVENETGSVYTCVAPSSNFNISECSVGPIFVYKAIFLDIHPNSSNDLRLSPGKSQQFQCTSKPERTIIMWETSDIDQNIDIEVRGQSIDVKVLSESTFNGMITLTCVGTLGMHGASKSITLDISALKKDTSIYISHTRDDKLYFIFGGLTLTLVLVVFIFLVVGCRKCLILRSRVEIYDVRRTIGSSQDTHSDDYPASADSEKNCSDNHTFIGKTVEYQEVLRNGESSNEPQIDDNQSDLYAMIPERNTRAVLKSVEHPNRTAGSESQFYAMADRKNEGNFQSSDVKSLRGNRTMSVVYATPHTGRTMTEKEDVGAESDAIAFKKTSTPPYAIVNKRRLIVIPDDTIDEENAESSNNDNCSYA